MGHAEAIVQIKWRAHRARTEVSPNLLRGGFAIEKGDFEKRPYWPLVYPWGACGLLLDSLPALTFTHRAGCSRQSWRLERALPIHNGEPLICETILTSVRKKVACLGTVACLMWTLPYGNKMRCYASCRAAGYASSAGILAFHQLGVSLRSCPVRLTLVRYLQRRRRLLFYHVKDDRHVVQTR